MSNERTGAETLRLIVKNLDSTRESFNDQFTLNELVKIGLALLNCDYGIYPDEWSPRQVQEALKGCSPMWDDNGQPIYK